MLSSAHSCVSASVMFRPAYFCCTRWRAASDSQCLSSDPHTDVLMAFIELVNHAINFSAAVLTPDHVLMYPSTFDHSDLMPSNRSRRIFLSLSNSSSTETVAILAASAQCPDSRASKIASNAPVASFHSSPNCLPSQLIASPPAPVLLRMYAPSAIIAPITRPIGDRMALIAVISPPMTTPAATIVAPTPAMMAPTVDSA